MISRILSAIRALRHGDRMRHELDDEIAFHIEALAEDLMRRGMGPDEARREARRRFGATEPVHEGSRRAQEVAFFDEAARNARFAFRSMARSPLLTGAFVLTLALCIGFGTAVFSTVDSMLWRTLPYPDAERLALAGLYDPAAGQPEGYMAVDGASWLRIRDEADGFQTAVYSPWVTGVNLATDETARFAREQRVGSGFFATLGVAPFMGREFTAVEDVPDGPALAVLSHGLWHDVFGGAPDILGGTIRLKGELHTVVGIMPEGFRTDDQVDVWTPLRASTVGEGGGTNLTALVRLPAGMSWDEAQARFAAIETPIHEAVPEARFGLVSLERALSSGMRLPLLVFLGAVGLMVLVGCANLAGVQLSRALTRDVEMSTRKALGSGTGALVRQLLAENALLGLVGGLVGLGVAAVSLSGLGELIRTNVGAVVPIALDGRAFAVALALTFVATLVFGLTPVLQVRRTDALRLLVSGTRGVAGATGRRLRSALIVGQVGVVTVLLFAALLLARSYAHLTQLDPGFESAGVTTVQLSLDDARYADAAAVNRLMDGTLEDLRALPEVAGAAVALSLPYERPLNMPFRLPGEDRNASPRIANLVYVTPGFFEALGIPVLEGRTLRGEDRADAPPVVVASQTFVDRYTEGRAELGTSIDIGLGGPELELVGVVGDVQQSSAGWGSSQPVWTAPTLYVPVAQVPGGFLQQIHVWFSPSWVIKTRTPSPSMMSRLTQVFESHDRQLPVARAASLDAVVAEAFARTRFQAVFLIVVAAFALLLAGVGLYGIVAQEVLHRRREMGVRMALGVSPRGAVLHTGLKGVRLAGWGLLLGGIAAAAGGRVLASLAWGVNPTDPAGFVVLLLAVGALAATASFVPAMRLGRLDPASVLRE